MREGALMALLMASVCVRNTHVATPPLAGRGALQVRTCCSELFTTCPTHAYEMLQRSSSNFCYHILLQCSAASATCIPAPRAEQESLTSCAAIQAMEGCVSDPSRGMAFSTHSCLHHLILNRRSIGVLRGSAAPSCSILPTQTERRRSASGFLSSISSGISYSDVSRRERRQQMQGAAPGLLLRSADRARCTADLLGQGTSGRFQAARAQGIGNRVARKAHERAITDSVGNVGEHVHGTLQISTFNIWCPLFRRIEGGGAGRDGAARECDYRELYVPRNLEIIEQILQEDSDIVCIQEFWVDNADMVELYKKRLEHKYHMHQLCRTGGRGDGLVTLLKHGIQVKDKRDIMFRDLGDRVAMLLRIDIPINACRTHSEALNADHSHLRVIDTSTPMSAHDPDRSSPDNTGEHPGGNPEHCANAVS